MQKAHTKRRDYTHGAAGTCGTIAAAGAVIVAAGVSALPAATCAVMANTYVTAITDFGSAALFAGLSYSAIRAVSFLTDGIRTPWTLVVPGIAYTLFLVAVFDGTYNVKAAISVCPIATNVESAPHQPQQPLLADMMHFWRVFTLPSHSID